MKCSAGKTDIVEHGPGTDMISHFLFHVVAIVTGTHSSDVGWPVSALHCSGLFPGLILSAESP